jgi:uncharacterized protein
MAVVGRDGEVLASNTVFPHSGSTHRAAATSALHECLNKFGVEMIVVGDGQGCRETELFVADILKTHPAVRIATLKLT